MNSPDYISDAWREVLRLNQADNFESLWEVAPDSWFESPNQARGGWSGVTRQVLQLPDGGTAGIFVKRQENHVYHSWRHWFRPTATLEREFRNCQRFQTLGIASMEPLYFAQRKVEGKWRAILITRELEGFQSLDSKAYQPINQLSRDKRNQLIDSVAGLIRQLHEHHIQHTCLYPKHLFVRQNPDLTVDTRFIDLEKARRHPIKRWIALRDMNSLQRHAIGWSRTDRLRLFLAYRQESKLSPTSKRMVIAILGKKHKKRNQG